VKLSHSTLLAALTISSLVVPQTAQANLFRINIDETGGDVVFSFDGSIDLTGATDTGQNVAVRQVFMAGDAGGAFDDSNRRISMGGQNGATSSTGRTYNFGTGGPLPVFGTNTNHYGADPAYGGYTITGSGDTFTIRESKVVLSPFVSGTIREISGQMTFENTTFSTFGIIPGTYSYTLGNNNMEIVATPGPLPILGLPVLFFYHRKLKHNSRLKVGAKQAPIGASNSKL